MMRIILHALSYLWYDPTNGHGCCETDSVLMELIEIVRRGVSGYATDKRIAILSPSVYPLLHQLTPRPLSMVPALLVELHQNRVDLGMKGITGIE